jgi:mRNA interferase HigB
MNVIARRRLQAWSEGYAEISRSLEQFYRTILHAKWQSLQDVRRIYRDADAVTVASGKTVTVFNIGGNKFRLVVAIHYNRQRVYLLRLMTHAEYSKNRWQKKL